MRTVVDANWSDMPFGSGLSINVSEGVVTLAGVTAGSENASPTIEEIKQIDGVSSVKNEVLVARQGYGV